MYPRSPLLLSPLARKEKVHKMFYSHKEPYLITPNFWKILFLVNPRLLS